MIRPRMARPVKLFLVSTALLAAASALSACATFGTASIRVPASQGALHQGAVLFNQRCSGCHSLSYAATHGSAANVRTSQYNNGPNFDQRCERPVTRVLYAIENGGFSGAIMPQNIVVGEQAIDVAKFVSTYSGRKAPKIPGVVPCQREQVGTIPSPTGAGAPAASSQAKQVAKQQQGASGKVRPTKGKHKSRSAGGAAGAAGSQGQGKGAP